MTEPGVVIVGSINRDYVCRVPQLPGPGETVLGENLALGAGGKGGNQAVAAALMKVPTSLVGCVGDDADGHALREALAQRQVNVDRVMIDPAAATGAAFVFVTTAGENSIVVVPGANSLLSADRVTQHLRDDLTAADVMVVQAEIPVEAVVAAVDTAAEVGARVVLNLAPVAALPGRVVLSSDPLVVNEAEAKTLLKLDDDVDGSILALELLNVARSAVVTLGAAGAALAYDGRTARVPAESVHVIDTTGAGDAFTGVLAASIADGADLLEAVRMGVRVATHSVQRPGAQASYPTLTQIRDE